MMHVNKSAISVFLRYSFSRIQNKPRMPAPRLDPPFNIADSGKDNTALCPIYIYIYIYIIIKFI